MQQWLKISLLLCVFGFFKDFRPSEHFVYEFLTGPWRNFTQEEVTQKIYPIATYSYLAQLIIIFLITDFLRYKPLIILLGVSGLIIWSLLLWTKSLLELQIVEVFFGTYMATEVAYYTYMYAKVPQAYYLQVTGHARAAILCGRFLSGVIGQLLSSFQIMDFYELNYLTYGAQIVATIWAFLLPKANKSIYFNQDYDSTAPILTWSLRIKKAFELLWNHFTTAYSNISVIKWSLWWALATCGFIQVQSYMQPLWFVIQSSKEAMIYNGAVEAVLTLLGTIAALVASCLSTDWKLKGELLLTICSIVQAAALFITSQTTHIFVSYASYIVFGSSYHFIITIVSSEVAKHIPQDSYGLVFGLNTLIALLLQTLMMFIVVEDFGFALKPREQYIVYGGYFIAISVIYIVFGLINWCKIKRRPEIL